MSFLAVSRESFWIDELTTTHFASQPSLKAMWQEMLRLRWPELQAPLYMAYMWFWQHLFGTGEWTSRLAGVPWFVIGATFFVISFRTPLERVCASLLVAFNSFTWFYLNEARLYSVELGLTYFVIGTVIRLQHVNSQGMKVEFKWLVALFLGVSLLSLLTVLGMIWVSAVFVLLPALFSLRTLLSWIRGHRLLIVATAIVLVTTAAYYLWTRSLGTRAADTGGSDWKNLGFILYEVLGFNGLGPGRLALRENGLSALRPWLPITAVFAIVVGTVLIAALDELSRAGRWRATLTVILALALPVFFLLAIAFLMSFRLLGRHCTPVVAVIVLLFTLGASALWRRKPWWGRIALVAFFALSLISCLSQRFAYRHAKDDYRTAASLAKDALQRGQSVWWNADAFGCEYYGLNASEDPSVPGKAWILRPPAAGFEAAVTNPDLVIRSKPDIYDPNGKVQRFLTQAGYVPQRILPAFVVFRRPTGLSSSGGPNSEEIH